MSIKTWIPGFIAAALALAVGAAGASTVVSTVGDKDGLGLGLANGDGFNFRLVGPADADGTDEWHDGNFSFVHDYALAGPITSASIELFSGGWGLDAPAGLYLDNTFVGNLTDGDDVGPLYNDAYKDIFDLTPFAALLTGHDTCEIRPPRGIDDTGALDYAQLTVTTAGVTAVPEPGTHALVALALVALVTVRRRRK